MVNYLERSDRQLWHLKNHAAAGVSVQEAWTTDVNCQCRVLEPGNIFVGLDTDVQDPGLFCLHASFPLSFFRHHLFSLQNH